VAMEIYWSVKGSRIPRRPILVDRRPTGSDQPSSQWKIKTAVSRGSVTSHIKTSPTNPEVRHSDLAKREIHLPGGSAAPGQHLMAKNWKLLGGGGGIVLRIYGIGGWEKRVRSARNPKGGRGHFEFGCDFAKGSPLCFQKPGRLSKRDSFRKKNVWHIGGQRVDERYLAIPYPGTSREI